MKKAILIIIAAMAIMCAINAGAYLEGNPELSIGCKCFVGHECYNGKDYDFDRVVCIEQFCGPCDESCRTWNNKTKACWSCGECGSVDKDNDGYGGAGCKGPDCNDNNALINPGRKELCNDIDDNCNNEIDDGLERYTADGSANDCCQEASDCLNAEGKCVVSGYYDYDYLCVNGNWTSRTSYLAAPLLKFAQNRNEKNLSLFCGNYSQTLNNYEYGASLGTLAGTIAATFFEPNGRCGAIPCADSICVLKLKDDFVLVGVSMNGAFTTEGLNEFLQYQGDCSAAFDASDGNFHSCSPRTLSLNTKFNLLIYSTQEFQLSEDSDLWEDFAYFIRSSVEEIYATFNKPKELMRVITPNRLYLLQQESRNIFGLIQPSIKRGDSKKEVLAIRYSNFLTDICAEINEVSPGACHATNTTKLITGERTVGTEEKKELFEIWADITAKPRITGNVTPCVEEAKSYATTALGTGCCFGLKPMNGGDGRIVCTKCGNGVCGPGETEQNCPDCVNATGCVGEGGSYAAGSGQSCCEGLEAIGCKAPDSNGACPQTECTNRIICTDCGDGQCGFGENKCNCPDCNIGEACPGPGTLVSADQTCCNVPNLIKINNSVLSQNGECTPPTGEICNKCGNNICEGEFKENWCNCPQDCGNP